MTLSPDAIVGCVLAGGQSRRMLAPDKGLREVAGRSMIGRVLERLAPDCGALILSANGDPGRFARFGLPVVPDLVGEGPLAGVLAALEHVAAHQPHAGFLVTAPGDTPFLPDGFVAALADAAEGGAIVVAASDSGRHPVVALWPVAVRGAVRAALAAGERRIGAFIEARAHRVVTFPPIRIGDAVVDPFVNVNTPEDLVQSEAYAKILEGGDTPAGAAGGALGFADPSEPGERRISAESPRRAAPARFPESARGGPAPRRLPDDCFDPGEGTRTYDQAVSVILERTPAVAEPETVGLLDGLDRILAERVTAPRNVPLADNAAVDGWAFRAADIAATGGFLPVAGRVLAGRAVAGPVPPGSAVRIFTGAALPPGVDTVAMQEDCETHAQDGMDFVVVPPDLPAGANRRRAGEDIAAGSVVLEPGVRLRPQDLGALASLGLATVTVRRRLRVALASTGDEVVRPGEPIVPGQIYDANHALVASLATLAGAEVTDLGVLPDDPAAVRAALSRAAESHDLLLTSGGVSEGEADHVATAIAALGRRHLWKVAVKPGRPLAFGRIGDCAVLGLPGNPVAAFAGMLLYAMPLMAALSGAAWRPPRRLALPAAFAIPERRTGRREFLRGFLVTGPDGRPMVDRFQRDGSSLISGLRAAEGFVDIAEDRREVARGDLVDFLPFSGFGFGGA